MDRLGLYMRSQFPIIQDSAWSSPLACSVVKPGNWVSKHEKTKDKRASKKTNNWDNTLPHLFHPPSCIIHNKAIWCGSLSQHPLPPARHQPHLLIPSTQTINQKKAKNPEIRFNSQQIILYCLALLTQNPQA